MDLIKSRHIINDDEIHIWRFNLDPVKSFNEFFINLLSDEEKKQVEKIKLGDVKNRSIISKAIIKNIISNYLGLNIKQIIFSYNEFGKPVIPERINSFRLNFNISHSGDLGLIAITRKNLIGIDVEKMNELDQIDDIINLCFTETEKYMLSCLESTEKKEVFYKIWTGKEAFIKAIGKGFSFPLKNISFRLNSKKEMVIGEILDPMNTGKDWQIYNFNPQDNYTSALVINNNYFKIRQYIWSPSEFIN